MVCFSGVYHRLGLEISPWVYPGVVGEANSCDLFVACWFSHWASGAQSSSTVTFAVHPNLVLVIFVYASDAKAFPRLCIFDVDHDPGFGSFVFYTYLGSCFVPFAPLALHSLTRHKVLLYY